MVEIEELLGKTTWYHILKTIESENLNNRKPSITEVRKISGKAHQHNQIVFRFLRSIGAIEVGRRLDSRRTKQVQITRRGKEVMNCLRKIEEELL